MRRLLAFAAALIATAFLAFSPTRAAEAAADAGKGISPALWAVDGGQGQVVIMGSIHLLKPGTPWLTDRLQSMVAGADTIAVEIDRTPAANARIQALMQERGFYADGGSLEAALPPQLYRGAVAIAGMLGIPEQQFRRFRPWAASMVIGLGAVIKAGFDPAHGVEETLLRLARQDGKAIASLETADEVVAALADHPDSLQADMLRQAVDEFDTVDAMLSDLTAAWVTGDMAALETLLLDRMKESPAFYRALIVERNRAWLPQVKTILETPGRHVVMVGAAHLLGDDNLLKMLEAAGYKVRRIEG